MVNIEDFIKRLEQVLEYHNLNASSFADKIGVQRSSMSHLLSGRNKPSLDFILKILEVFPEVDLYWILNGTGSFPKVETKLNEPLIDFNGNEKKEDLVSTKKNSPDDLFSDIETVSVKNKNIETTLLHEQHQNLENNNEVEKIVFFYKNGTFKIYKP